MKIYTLLFPILITFTLSAESSDSVEIDHLLAYVKNTQCKYIRNGDVYNGTKAVQHIQRKYDYFKDDIRSAEDFIRLSATKSIILGSKYHIKCPGQKKVESASWLLDELHRYRNNKK